MSSAQADLKATKDALVASLFELSRAANDAAGATIKFFNAASKTPSASSDPATAAVLKDLVANFGALTSAAGEINTSVSSIAPAAAAAAAAAAAKPAAKAAAKPRAKAAAPAQADDSKTAAAAAAETPATPAKAKRATKASKAAAAAAAAANGAANGAASGTDAEANGDASTAPTSTATPKSAKESKLNERSEKNPEEDSPAPKKRKVQDPNAPKKPLTMFFAFNAYCRQVLKEQRSKLSLPPLNSADMTQEVTKRWTALSEEEKAKWKKSYAEQLEVYNKEKDRYVAAKQAKEEGGDANAEDLDLSQLSLAYVIKTPIDPYTEDEADLKAKREKEESKEKAGKESVKDGKEQQEPKKERKEKKEKKDKKKKEKSKRKSVGSQE